MQVKFGLAVAISITPIAIAVKVLRPNLRPYLTRKIAWGISTIDARGVGLVRGPRAEAR